MFVFHYQVAAQNCRKRKMEEIEVLEAEVEQMREERNTLARSRDSMNKLKNQVSTKSSQSTRVL